MGQIISNYAKERDKRKTICGEDGMSGREPTETQTPAPPDREQSKWNTAMFKVK
jgi:hypothetical protein